MDGFYNSPSQESKLTRADHVMNYHYGSEDFKRKLNSMWTKDLWMLDTNRDTLTPDSILKF